MPPSASPISCATRASATSPTAAASAAQEAEPGTTGSSPAAPLAKSRTVSFVLVHPSTDRSLNRGLSFACASDRRSDVATRASVVRKVSIVARFGLIIPTPLAAPPTRIPPALAVADFGTVSVVMIARSKPSPPSGASAPIRRGSASIIGVTWSGSPITPVEHGSTSRGSTRSSAAAAALVAAASSRPRRPVPAFAWPLFTRTARPRPVGEPPAPEHHRGGRHRVRREQPGRRRAGVADQQRQVRPPARLEAGRDPGRAEAVGEGDPPAHGYTAVVGSAVASSNPWTRFAFWIACPAAPLIEVVDRTDDHGGARPRIGDGLQLDRRSCHACASRRPCRPARGPGRTRGPRTRRRGPR